MTRDTKGARNGTEDEDTGMTAAIEIQGLHKSFGDLEVLRGIDFTVAHGEVVCVIGPSGSGKSTLLRCTNLLEEPTSGRVVVAGADLTDPTSTSTAYAAGSAWSSSSSTSSRT